LRHWRGEWWHWDGKRYGKLAEDDLGSQLTAIVKEDFDRLAAAISEKPLQVSRSCIGNVLNALKSMTAVSSEVEQSVWLTSNDRATDYLALANGLVNIEQLLVHHQSTLTPHSPDWFSTVCLPYDYDKTATCSAWAGFLHEVLERDQERINLLQEWFGYALLHDTSQQKFLVLEGEGGNGKSVVLEILAALVGTTNVSHVPLEVFGERFQLTPTIGKLLNIAPEVGEVGRPAEGVIKQFTGGDRMYFDRKGVAGVEVYPTARLVIAANNRPAFVDRSNGLWRRMMLLPFRVSIPEERQDRTLGRKLKLELPGIFNWAVEGLRRLRQNGRFTEPRLSREALDAYKRESNPARTFLTEYCAADPRAAVPTSHLYARYREHCNAAGIRPLNESEFGKELRRAYPGVERTRVRRDGNRVWVYAGLDWDQVSQVSQASLSSSDFRENQEGIEIPRTPRTGGTASAPSASGSADAKAPSDSRSD
jgi:putative DNA primase/helicase